jgi:hypothetical protein
MFILLSLGSHDDKYLKAQPKLPYKGYANTELLGHVRIG